PTGAADKGGQTPLHLAAAYNGNINVFKYLVSVTTDLNVKDHEGKTAYDVASTDAKKHILWAARGRPASRLSPE
ncbi:MAG TPA: hypothetical protein DEB39_12695, partial [Planctomycetaceae bacterium]|nr:hypothetical protein [Planctomycetaceae bacterium]